jgi:hypothetical protein
MLALRKSCRECHTQSFRYRLDGAFAAGTSGLLDHCGIALTPAPPAHLGL